MNTDAVPPPSLFSTRPPIVSYHAVKTEEENLIDWLKKNNPGAEVFIHENPQIDKLREIGWERFPATWRGKQIWIKRKPVKDMKWGHHGIGSSA